jgi:hypothetical protein
MVSTFYLYLRKVSRKKVSNYRQIRLPIAFQLGLKYYILNFCNQLVSYTLVIFNEQILMNDVVHMREY